MSAWEDAFPGCWANKMLKEGWRLNLKERAGAPNIKEYKHSAKDRKQLSAHLAKYLEIGVVKPPRETGTPLEWYYPIFLATQKSKPEGRLVFNLKGLNLAIRN